MTYLPDEKKIEILIHLQKIQFEEVMARRKREFNTFVWTVTLFVFFIAVLAVSDKSKEIVWKSYGNMGKAVVSAILLLVVLFSITWQNRERKFLNGNQKVIARINKALHAFESNLFIPDEADPILPVEWQDWGSTKISAFRRLLKPNYITATWLLGVLSIVMVWLS